MRLCQMYNGLISYICSMYEKNPEEETFKTFFLKYHDVLVLYAASILKNVDAAEDVVLGCFVQAWESSLYKKLSDGLDKYMFHVVKNAALNDLRDSKRRKARHEKMMEEMTGNVRRACKEMIEVSLDEAVGIMEERMTA